MAATLPRRAEVAVEHTWDLASLYASVVEWEADVRTLDSLLPEIAALRGRLTASPTTLLSWFRLFERTSVLAGRIFSYAQLSFDVDTGNQEAAALRERAIGLVTKLSSTAAFVEPELVAADEARIDELLTTAPELQLYRHYLADLRRRAAFVRSGEVEEVLARAADPLSTPYSAYILLADSDLRFVDAADSEGQPWQVTRGTINELLQSSDRTLRRSAWVSYQDGFLAFKNTFGAIYAGSVKADLFRARARGYPNSLEASLHIDNLPRSVYENIIDACNRHLPIWHRYWELRRRALGLEQLEACDIWAPFGPVQRVAYDDAVAMICAGMAPLGSEYVEVSRAGLTSERWVDIYPNIGKTSGAYSGGSYGGKPYILMNYDGTLGSMSTLAHELGHSMHTWHTNRAQPELYSNVSLFVAEVASNFNQALLRASLLSTPQAPAFELGLLEEAMSNFHRYLFLMPILSQFEVQIHEQAEAGEPLTASGMSATLTELFRRAYGPAVRVDPERDGIVWAQFPHLYSNFYVFQYASGIAAANALAQELLDGAPGARERYLGLLADGRSRDPLDAMRNAGIDMTTAEPMDRAFDVLAGFVKRLERLVG